MSKQRAQRRAEREAAGAAERARRQRQQARRRRLAALRPRRRRRARPTSRLTAQRRRQDGVLLAVLVALHAVLWLSTGSWWVRLSALLLTVLAWPVLVTVLFDRRPRL